MTALYDADSSSNWLQIYQGSFEADFIQGQQVPVYLPIPSTELPIDIDSSLLAVYCTSTQFPELKKYVGSIIQSINASGIFPTATVTGKGRGIYSNQTTLLEFPLYDDPYRLVFNPKYYIEQASLTVYKYVGSTYYVIENRLNIIESKIDQLSP